MIISQANQIIWFSATEIHSKCYVIRSRVFKVLAYIRLCAYGTAILIAQTKLPLFPIPHDFFTPAMMQSRMSTTEIVNRFTQTTDSQHTHITLIDEVFNIVQKLLKTMLVQMFRPDVSQIVLRGDLVGGDLVFFDQLADVKKPQRDVFRTRSECPVPEDM